MTDGPMIQTFWVPVPFRGNWGLLRKNKKWYDLKLQMFPPPLKVTEGSYEKRNGT